MATAPTNAGSYAVQATLTNANYEADPIEGTLEVAKAAGSVSISNLPSNATFGGSFTPTYAKAGDGTASTTSNTPSVCSISAGVISFNAVGTCKLQASVTEGTNHLAATGSEQSFTITAASTTTSVTITPGSQQYSDKVTLEATISPVSISGDAPATGVTFKIGTRTVGTGTLSAAGSQLKATLSGVVLTEAPGLYTVTAEFTGVSSNFNVSNATAPLSVTPENATAEFSGALFYAVPSGNATVTLSAIVTDAADGSRGDIRNAKVTFVNRDTSATLCGPLNVGLVTTGDTTVGATSCNVSLSYGSGSSIQYTIGIKVGGYYLDDNSAENTVVTVSQATSGMITGGGYLVNSNSGGQYAGDTGQKTNFGFNVKYNKSKTSLQGNINVIVRRGGRSYQIKGNSMTSLTTVPNAVGGTATFNGKANIQDITNPLAPVSVDGNASLQVTLTDKGEPGREDTIGITLWDKNGGLWFSSNWTSPRTVEQRLGGGNLVVR